MDRHSNAHEYMDGDLQSYGIQNIHEYEHTRTDFDVHANDDTHGTMRDLPGGA